jgi:hypothetical protein
MRMTSKRAFLQGLWTWLFVATMFAVLITGLLAMIWIAFGAPNWLRVARLLALVFAGAWGFASLVALPMGLASLCRRTRLIRVRNGILEMRGACCPRKIPLDRATWSVTRSPSDDCTIYLPDRSYVQVRLEQAQIVCGFDDRRREEWAEFLTAAGVPRERSISRWKLGFVLVGSVCCFGLLGMLVGYGIAQAGGNPTWIGLASFLGMLDGLILAGMSYLRVRSLTRESEKRLHPLIAGIVTVGVTVKVVAWAVGVLTALAVGALHGLALAVLVWRLDRVYTELRDVARIDATAAT